MVPFLLLFLAFIAEQSSSGMRYSFGHFGSALLITSSTKTLPTHRLLGEWGNVGESLYAVHALLNRSRNNGVLSTPSSHQYKVQHYEGCYGENLLDPTDSATVMTSCCMWGTGMLCLRSYSISPGTTRETQWCWGWLHLCIHRKHWATAQLNLCLLILVIRRPLTPQIYTCSYYQWTIHMQLHVSNDIWGLFYYTLKRKK